MRQEDRNRRGFLSATAASVAATATVVKTARLARASAGGKPRIRVGQIGVAHGHATKISVYRDSEDYEVVGIVEPDAALRAKAESEKAYQDLPWITQEQLLNVPDLQVVLVETAPRHSLDVAEACVAAGKHIHLDKPAGESLAHFERILDDAQRQRLLVQMGYMYRYNPAVVLLREFVQRGWLGQPFEVHAVMSKVVNPSARTRLADYPGGMMFELGCHLIDLVVGLMGEPSQVDAFQRRSTVQADTLADNMLAVLQYPNAMATVKSSALEVEGFARRHLVVCGTEGTFHIQPLDSPAAKIALKQPRGDYRAGIQEVQFDPYTRYVEDAAEMARILRGEQESRFSPEHDLSVQRTVLRASGLPIH